MRRRLRAATLALVLAMTTAWAAECPDGCRDDLECVPVGQDICAPQACQCDGDVPTTDNWERVGGHACFNDKPCTLTSAGSYDGGAAAFTKPCRRATTLPATCQEGECFQDTDSSGAELYICTAPNTWTSVGSGSSSVTSQAGVVGDLVTDKASDGQTIGPQTNANAICTATGDPRACCNGMGTGTCQPTIDQTSYEVKALGYRVYASKTAGTCIELPEATDNGATVCTICSGNQLAADGSTVVTMTGCQLGPHQACVTLDGATSADDDYPLWISPSAATLLSATCHCSANCGTAATLSFQDRAANAIALTGGGDLTCASGSSASSYTAFDTGDTDRVLVSGEGVAFDVTNSPTAGARLTLCVRMLL